MSNRSPRQQVRRAVVTTMVGVFIAVGTAGITASDHLAGAATTTPRPDVATASGDAGAPCWDPPADVALLLASAGGIPTSPCMVAPPGPANTLPLDYHAGVAMNVADIQYGPDPAQQLDLYLPKALPAPVLVYFHPGGWVAGDRTGVAPSILQQVKRGYAVASVEYRLAPQVRFPVPLQDAKTAVRWVKANARQFGLRADKVFAAGTSAGGHLAAMVAVTPGLFEPVGLPADLAAQNSRVIAAVTEVGPLDLTALSEEVGTWGPGLVAKLLDCPTPADDEAASCSPEAMAAASPVNYVTPDDPPIYLSYGAQDVLVPPSTNGLAMAAGYAHVGRRFQARFDLVQNQGHNLDLDGMNVTMLNRFLDWSRDGVLK